MSYVSARRRPRIDPLDKLVEAAIAVPGHVPERVHALDQIPLGITGEPLHGPVRPANRYGPFARVPRKRVFAAQRVHLPDQGAANVQLVAR